ncbi:MAG: YfhO family protein [Eubacteriales bacterium]|nr:YfhO family protein [Eubacteriales bacterium]
MRLRKRAQWNFAALGFAIPCLGMLFVMLISHYAPFGKYSMLYSDMYHQYYPFFVAFRNAIREGRGLLYTWSVGMGMDYLGLIAYYLASPLNLVSVLLPESWLLGYFSLLVPIKLGLAGLFFSLFLKELFHKNDLSIAVFGALYGLCAWALGYQWNVMWLDTFALLPMVVLGEVKLLQDNKVLLYTVSLFFSVFANYYIGLFTCFFVFFLFFIYEICRWSGWKKFFCDLLRIGLFSMIALGMTAILTVPALFALGTTQSSVNKFPTSFQLNIAGKNTLMGLLDAMRQVAGNMGGSLEPSFKEGLPNLYCGIISVFLMFLYLFAKQVKLRDKVCAATLLVFFNLSFIIRQLDYIWHGFHFTNMIPYRFSFLYSFVVLYMAYRAWLLRKSFSTKRILAAAVLAAGVLACSNELTETVELTIFGGTIDFPLYFVYNLVFLVLYLLAMLAGNVVESVPEEAEPSEAARIRRENSRQRRRSRALVLTVACVELAANLICFGLYFPGTGVSDYPKGTEKTASVIRYMKEREKNTLFYRAETTHSQTLNDGALNSYNGVSAFTSSANVKTTLFMQALGYGAKNTYNRYLFEESSPVANLFLNLKYMIERDGKDRTSTYFTEVNRFGNTALLENKAYLPLGFLAESALGELEFTTSGNAFSFQNDLFSAATGEDGDVWHKLTGDNLSLLPNGAQISEQNDTGYCRYVTTDKAEVIYSFTADRDGFACVHLDLPKRNDFYVSVNAVELYKEKISLPQMLAVSDVKTGDTIDVRIVCGADESSTMTVSAAILNPERFQAGYEVLNASLLDLTSFKSTRVEGTIDCDRDGLLYTSIPQNGNWQATVDGTPVETVLVGDCMLALPLTAGSHSVKIVYRNSAFILGLRISLACAAVFVVLMLTCYRSEIRRKTGKFARGKDRREK